MDGANSLADRLSRISTQWTCLIRAHQQQHGEGSHPDLGDLLQRYAPAVFQYLVGALRNEDAAEDLAQEFAVRFLRGDFHRVQPGRGRFRDYLKTALSHLVADHYRDRRASPQPLPIDLSMPEAPASESDFVACWRSELLERTWAALAEAKPAYHAALYLRVHEPDLTSPALAAKLSDMFKKPVTAVLARKHIERAHDTFARLLIAEVNASLEKPSEDDLRDELRLLDLWRYTKEVFS